MQNFYPGFVGGLNLKWSVCIRLSYR